MIKLYNTLNRKKEEFVPLNEGEVKMYVCGPTVYDNIHIGNARPIIMFDLIRRYFEYRGYKVTFVQNYTDVDDKIIARANEKNMSIKEFSEFYIKEIEDDIVKLGVHKATINPKATEQIDNMLKMIDTLIKKGHAYEVDGSVFFETKTFDGYGKLSKKNIEDLEAGARISVDETKRSPMDFVLWKPKKEGEAAWASPYGEGRPGWHIECSVMAKAMLGDTIDIHAGGTDLIFPHHENEIAQSECANGAKFANYWLHNGFINIDNKKMSKSKGNFFMVKDIVKDFSYDEVRFFIISAHYRSPVNFSREVMEASRNALDRIRNGYNTVSFYLKDTVVDTYDEVEELKAFRNKFITVMDDDFNTADAITVVFEAIKRTNVLVKAGESKELVYQYKMLLEELIEVLGIPLFNNEIDDEEILKLIEERNEARKERNFARADEIRDMLKDKNIILEDTREGVKFKRV